MKQLIVILLMIYTLTLNLMGLASNNHSPERNDRFANHPNFILNTHSLSGVGRSSDGRWGTLISSNIFISAYHYAPTQSLTFHKTNDPNGEKTTKTIIGGHRIGQTDLYIGLLDSPIADGYTTYTFASTSMEFSNNPFTNFFNPAPNYYHLGQSQTTDNSYSKTTNLSTEQNTISGIQRSFTDNNSGSIGDIILTSSNNITLQSGDSGAPMFSISKTSNLTIVGINWFIGETNNRQAINAMTDVGSYANQLQSYIANPASLVPIPEPQTYALIFSAFILGAILYRKRYPASRY